MRPSVEDSGLIRKGDFLKTHYIGNPSCLMLGHDWEYKRGEKGKWRECKRCPTIQFGVDSKK